MNKNTLLIIKAPNRGGTAPCQTPPALQSRAELTSF